MAYLNGRQVPDDVVVAAFNSCLDLEKWKALPSSVQDRIKDLMRSHRLKFVCFSDSLGLGLRVYSDARMVEFSSDEASVQQGKDLTLDLDGYWMRCPPSKYEEFVKGGDQFLVMNEEGTKFVRTWDDSTEEATWTLSVMSTSRTLAYKFPTKSAAEDVANQVRGVVVTYKAKPTPAAKKALPKLGKAEPDPDDDDEEDTSDE